MIRTGVPRAALRDLLRAVDLPVDDLEELDLRHCLRCGSEDDPRGVVGLELYGEQGLLRSLAVRPAARGHGCGVALVVAAERHAAIHGVRTLHLLTETAEGFFRGLGYEPCQRSDAPEAIRRTRQFAGLCPESAAFLSKSLTDSV
ncbi:MAG: arsenic resistance N-acetyltransferase ArsN2 [Acidobacteriota bacterium]